MPVRFISRTLAPIAKVRAALWSGAVLALLPILNALLSLFGITPLSPADAEAIWGSLEAAYLAIGALIAALVAWLRNPEAGDAPIPANIRNR